MHLGTCQGCKQEAMVNYAYGRAGVKVSIPPGDYCADCFDKLLLGEVKRSGPLGREAKGDTVSSWDNAVKAYEEDR